MCLVRWFFLPSVLLLAPPATSRSDEPSLTANVGLGAPRGGLEAGDSEPVESEDEPRRR
jgi:hypothetical protein